MYSISEECRQAIQNYKRDLRARITIDNYVIEDGDIISFDIEESIVADDDFTLGGGVASSLLVKLNNLHGLYDINRFKGKEVKVEIGIILKNNLVEYVPMGIFIVEEYIEDKRVISLEAVDKMVSFEKDYISKLTYPTTALTVLQEICSICGVVLSTTNFDNSNYAIEKPLEFVTCREIVHDIAVLAGGFAKMNREGKLVLLTPTNTNLEINKDNYMELEVKEPFYIDKLTITETYLPIEPIPLNLNVIPFMSKWQGNFSLDVGDGIKLNDDKTIYETIVTSQKIAFNGGLRYESSCTGLSEQQKDTQHISNQKKQNKKFSSEIKQNADEIALRVTSEEFEATIKILDDEIASKVTAEDVESLVIQKADSWELSINGKLVGRTYRFDGEGFTLGGTEGDIAKHTPSGSEYKFTDGSTAKIDKDGFYNQFGSSKREYNHLNYAFSGTIMTNDEGVFEVDIALPEEFRGKNFIVMPYIQDSYIPPNKGGMIIRYGIWPKALNIEGGGITLRGQVATLSLSESYDNAKALNYYVRYDSQPVYAAVNVHYGLTVIA